MPDWGGGFFSAFMAAKDVGKGKKGGTLPNGEPVRDQTTMAGNTSDYSDPGWIYNVNTDTYEMADGSEIPGNGGFDPNGPPSGGGQGGPPRQGGAWGGAWGGGRGFGR